MFPTWVKRAFCAVLCASAIAAFASCGNSVQGVERPSGKTVLKVGDYSVCDCEFDYYYKNCVITDGMEPDAAREAALDDVRRNCAVLAMAKEYGVELSSAKLEEVTQLISDMESELGADRFEAGLSQYFMTRELYVYLMQLGELETELREYVTDERSGLIKSDDATVEAAINNDFIAVKQILISNDEGDDPTANAALAAELAERIAAGEDFDALLAEYGEDENNDPEYGRCFIPGMFPEAFEKAATALAEGEISGAVESEVGYHIIKRMPIDPAYVEKNFEQLRYYFLTAEFNKLLEAKRSELEVEWKD